MEITQEELDKLFDNGYSYEDYSDAPVFKRMIMLGTRVENPKFFNHEEIREIKINGWLKTGEIDGYGVFQKDDKIFVGNNN